MACTALVGKAQVVAKKRVLVATSHTAASQGPELTSVVAMLAEASEECAWVLLRANARLGSGGD